MPSTMPTLMAATVSVSGLRPALTIFLPWAQATASARATYAPVMAAVRVPPSAWRTSQSRTMVFSPSAL
ncbi:hypothetical protein SCYAM73S_01778 [Streptomyces cyaneofuscatus]